MKTITSLYLLLFFLIGMYSCTPESSEYPKKYVYSSYSVKSAEMFSKEDVTSFEIVNGREEFIAGMEDTLKLALDSFFIGQYGFIKSFKVLDETLVRFEGVVDPGKVVNSLTTYFINNSFIYSPLEDSTNYVIGFKESEELIVKDYITTIIKPSVNNPMGFHSGFTFDDLEDLTVNEYILNLNEEGRISIGDTVLAMVYSYNYILE